MNSYGRVQNVKLLGRTESGSTVANASSCTNSGVCATVAFMDIKSASKAHNAEHVLDERTLTTEYYEPAAIPSAAGAPSAGSSPAGSGYSGSSSSVNSTPAPSSVSRYHLSGGEESTGSACPLAATAAAPANWRGTNDSASDYCRRGNTPAAYSRYQRNNSNAPYSTPPSNVERTTPHHRWYATGDRGGGGGGGGATGGESTPSTPGGGTESGRRRRPSGSGSSRSESSSPEPSDTSRASTPQAPPPALALHANHRAPSTPSHHHQWSSTASGRPLAICVRNLPTRSTDSSLKDGLYHEYKKHGKVVWVKVVGQNADRYAVVRFKKPSDVEKALEVSQDKLFFGCKISVAPHQSCDEDADSAKPYETDIDEYHPKATRTLFIGNLEKDVTQQQLREKFKHFGRIIEIDIKKGSGGGAGYAFCQYASISSVVEAIRAMDGEYVGGSRVKLGFGKPVATTCVWVDGLTEHTEKQVLGAISRCGAATSVCVDRAAGAALVHFEQAAAAGAAVRELRRVAAAAAAANAACVASANASTNTSTGANAAPSEPDHPRLCVDYASRECQEAFYEQLEKHGGAGTLNGVDRLTSETVAARYMATTRHDQLRYESCASRSRASSYTRASSRTPRYPTLDPYEGADYNAERRYRVYEELGSSPQPEDTVPFEDRLQSVVVSPHRARRHRRDSSPEDRKHSKERHRSVGGSSVVGCVVAGRRSRSGSRPGERHGTRRRHRRRRDGSGSRAGTPLRDEPDAPPAEPRRAPRERPPLPMSLPLPKFAVLLRQAPQTPRPAPVPAPAPDSPPRPPSVSSSSGGSAPHSPSLEERIRSLDEKYERWSGGARVPPSDPNRPKHRLLDVDIKEVKPSEVVRSLLAKRSVFDEDSERLESAVRAPSPAGSPRARVAPLTPRVLRYPFPTHPAPAVPPSTHHDGEPESSERSADPRLNRLDRPAPTLDRCAKFEEIDFRLESRVRPRTPSTDRSQPDSSDRKSPKIENSEPESESRTPSERRRRDSFYGTGKSCPDASVDNEAGPTPRSDLIEFDYRARDKSKALTSERRQSIGRSHELTAEKTVPAASDRKETFPYNEDKRIEITIINRNEDNNTRDAPDSFLKRIGNMHEMIKSESFVCRRNKSNDDYGIKSELPAHIDAEIKSTLNMNIKLEDIGLQSKNDSEKEKEILTPNHIKKEIIDTESPPNNLHSTTLVKANKEMLDVSQELIKNNEKNGKERFNQNIMFNAINNTKLEKENIEYEKKCLEPEPSGNTNFFGDKKTLENDKISEDRIKNDKGRSTKDRAEKEKHENEKEKVKSSKQEKVSEKDKKSKEDHNSDKGHGEKSEKKDSEKIQKERCDRDSDKIKHNDEKSSRHDHHRREKLDKRKDSTEGDTKVKKEEKSKHDRKKDSNDTKRETKRDGESSKSRKSSRDETSRDMCRKDSTDSSASRASHDSTKLKDNEINEIKEDVKPKIKHYLEIITKPEIEKDSSLKCLQSIKQEPKIKLETKEDKDVVEQIKIKNEINLEHSVKSKDIEKQRHYSLDSPNIESKRKERLNSCSSLPSHIGHKRRMSSQDSIDSLNEDTKKIRNESKSIDRKESKDSRSIERHKTAKFNKGHFAKLIESKTKDDKKNQVKPPDDTSVTNPSLTDSKDSKLCASMLLDKQKIARKSPSTDDGKSPLHLDSHNDSLQNDIDFLATLELRSSEEDERQKALRKEMKEKKRIQQLQQIHELQMQQDALQQAELLNKLKDDKKGKTNDEKKKDAARDKRLSTDRKSRDEKIDSTKRKNRKHLQSSDTSDSDEPKKHSIFDIIDDGPTYISMYDKVKARSCKNMQKQEEEKRQEKIKAKFSQLKQSRAKREEKKRSSWDEDSDSDHDRKKVQKASMESSTDDDNSMIYNKKQEKHGSSPDYDRNKLNEYFNVPTIEEDLRNKLSRKNSRTRIMSDTSDDDNSKRSISKSPNFTNESKKELMSISGSLNRTRDDPSHNKETSEDKIKKNSLLNLFGKSDSDDSKLKSSLETDSEYKPMFSKTTLHDFSSESDSTCNRNSSEIRKKHKKKQKKHKTSVSDGENKIENDTGTHERDIRHKISEKIRRHSNKKDKRKDKMRDSIDTDDTREEKNKLKRDKKLTSATSFDVGADSISKKDGKMEDIFGPLSDESDKDAKIPQISKIEFAAQDYEPSLNVNEQIPCEDNKIKEKDELKRRKEKRRKERRYLTKDDENSLDVDAVSKAIEARLFAESITDDDNRDGIDILPEYIKKIEQSEFKRVDDTLLADTYKSDKYSDRMKKDCREKRKKKKKNREDRQNRKDHHQFYHHDRLEKPESSSEAPIIEISSKEMLLDIPLPSDAPVISVTDKSDDNHSPSESPSLPRLTDSPPTEKVLNSENKNCDKDSSLDEHMETDYPETKQVEVDNIPMPPPIENIDISAVPLPEDPPAEPSPIRENFVTKFNDNIESSESAVRSISNLPLEIEKQSEKVESPPLSKVDKKPEEKPRAIISQEETEDAVAALLGESFGGKVAFTDYEQVESNSTHQTETQNTTIESENIPEEDAEEMRRAVQNLNASELEMKPDTPVSDNDLLLIDTDTEEADETPQETMDRLPVNIMATNQNITVSNPQPKLAEVSNIVIAKPKTTVVQVITTDSNETVVKVTEQDTKLPHTQRENVQVITSTPTPVITSWTLTNNKLIEPHMVNIQTSSLLNRDKNENKHAHITANIVQLKPQNQNVPGNNSLRPIINPNRVSAPFQVINQMIRPQSPNMQPPTIKIPEPHILYQKPSGIVISPRLQSNDPRLQSPKPTPQGESMTSPRLSNMAILSTSPQNMNSVGLASPTTIQQRSPGQVTVVRMQQPPLSPIQAMHLPHGARTMVSPNIPNSVLVQTQGAPIHFNRLPVTPVLAPISKQLTVNNVLHQNKTIAVSVSPTVQSKVLTGEIRKTDQRGGMDSVTETSKIILSPTSLPQSTNPTILTQNRLITMQHAVHVGNVNSALHIGNKVLLNNLNQLNDKRDNQVQKSEQLSHIPFGTTPIIHVAGVNHSTASLIQSGSKPVILQEANAVRSQGSNVIHTLNSQRLLTTAPITNVIQIDANKAPPSVLSMATIRPPTVLTKLDTSKSVVVTTPCLTNVVMTPVLLKTSTAPGSIIHNSKNDKDTADNNMGSNSLSRETETKQDEKVENKIPNFHLDAKEKYKCFKAAPVEPVAKCETDFEELLKDTTNEIKVTNDPEKKLEVNVGKKVTLVNVQSRERKLSFDGVKKEDPDKPNPVSEQSVLDVTFQLHKVEQKARISETDKENRENFIGNETISDSVSDSNPNNEAQKPETIRKDSPANTISKEEEKEFGNNNKTRESNIFGLVTNDAESIDNHLRNLDENESWSAKDINIDSVIKKVDSLCSDSNEATDKHEDKIEKDVSKLENSNESNLLTTALSNLDSTNPSSVKPLETQKDIPMETNNTEDDSITLKNVLTGKRGGRSARGKKADKVDRVQTRQISKPARGATSAKRGRGRGKVDKKIKSIVNSNSNNMPGDVYDFHEDSGDESTSPNKSESRPRLILTIKSPLSGQNNACPTSTLSITQKENAKIIEKSMKDEKGEDFISPSLNTRKSRRLQEKDVQKISADDTPDEFGRSPTTKTGKRRTTRQVGAKANQTVGADSRKSPRGVKRTRDRSLSDASLDSGDEKIIRREDVNREAKMPRLAETLTNNITKPDTEVPQTSVTRPNPSAVIQPAVAVVQSVTTQSSVVQPPVSTQPIIVHPVVSQPAPTPTPIMKPPKKMISEISAKLAGAFEAAVVSSVRMPIPCVAQQPQGSSRQVEAAVDAMPTGEYRAERRLVDNVPGSMMPVGATEATDARVQSPALPHRPPSTHRPADRATPILIRGGESEGVVGAGAGAGAVMGVGVAAGAAAGAVAGAAGAGVGAGGARYRGAYAGPASLPRGAHHPHHHPHVKQLAVIGPHHPAGAASRVTLLTSVPAISPQGQIGLGDAMYPHFSHQHYQVYQQHFRATQHENRASPSPYTRSLEAEGCEAPAPPLELRRPASARVPRPAHSPAPADRLIMYAVGCGRSPPPAHGTSRLPGALPPLAAPGPPHASQVPREADSLQMLLRRYPVMWQGLLALKNDSAAVQMHFVGGNHVVAGDTLPRLADGSAPLLRIAQRMRLEPAQLDQVHRKMKMENEHCMLLALPCGRDHMDVLQQSTNLTAGFITYLQRKQAAGIVNVAPPGHQQALYTVHIFPSCDFANENLNRIAPDLMHRVADIAHLLIVIATV
ncbi:hypothetical protein evm_005526 [Chilo suppressalis]|nr:hypothetical protein evm_005526 [Chilo suppressalis]